MTEEENQKHVTQYFKALIKSMPIEIVRTLDLSVAQAIGDSECVKYFIGKPELQLMGSDEMGDLTLNSVLEGALVAKMYDLLPGIGVLIGYALRKEEEKFNEALSFLSDGEEE